MWRSRTLLQYVLVRGYYELECNFVRSSKIQVSHRKIIFIVCFPNSLLQERVAEIYLKYFHSVQFFLFLQKLAVGLLPKHYFFWGSGPWYSHALTFVMWSWLQQSCWSVNIWCAVPLCRGGILLWDLFYALCFSLYVFFFFFNYLLSCFYRSWFPCGIFNKVCWRVLVVLEEYYSHPSYACFPQPATLFSSDSIVF